MTPSPSTARESRAVLSAMMAGVMILFSLWVVRPFLPATIWAVTIGITTWPLLLRIQKLLWGSRGLAVSVTTLIALIVFVLPFWLATTTVMTHSADLMQFGETVMKFRLPAEPDWLAHLPLVGPKLTSLWQRFENTRVPQLVDNMVPDTGHIIRWVLNYLGGFSMLALQFLLTLIIMAVLHMKGEAASALVLDFGNALAGQRGKDMVMLAGRTIRGVAVGVTVTALVETAVGGLGMKVTGVPWASVLIAITFIACLLQAGPGVTLIPAVLWMYIFQSPLNATILLAVTILTIVIDNVLRPYLIRKQANVPLILIMLGVIGGLSAFGLVGIFVGPVILSVTYTLVKSWLAEARAASPTTASAKP
ncbi:AI-2E family transporter [Acetobacter indonesiensis]|uniref:Membrane protein n=2 Tax=Acetobacter indonesiensis TaxID=104101 RepID=A0A6N3T815_9PROT|nr:AI-2E family transporter [Acetobacter indonesiensis]GEN03649.1 membrane protein [Acetobacter indonesiensis]